MYFELSNRIKRDEVRLPDDQQLKDQLGWQTYVPSDGPLKLIPKGRMPGSPGRADTVAMLFLGDTLGLTGIRHTRVLSPNSAQDSGMPLPARAFRKDRRKARE